jgi:hypothetical protein
MIFLDNIQINLDMVEVDRSLCQEKCKKYLDSITDFKKYAIISKILKNTKYISFSKFKKNLLRCISKLDIQYNIFFNLTTKIGSEHWVTLLVWSTLRNNCINVITDYNINNELPIVILDDCMYTGIHMCGVIDCIRNKGIMNEIIIVTPYTTIEAIEETLIFERVKHVYHSIIYNYLYIDGILDLHRSYGETEKGDIYEYVSNNLEMDHFGCPVYFDHKIANSYGSFPHIYKHVVKELPSRSKIEEVEKIINTLMI